jgi:hypothetical protein
MSTIEEKRAQQLAFINRLYDETEGYSMQTVSMWDIGNALGWDSRTTEQVVEYLANEGMIEITAMGGEISITHSGVQQTKAARSHPTQDTQYFPPFYVLSGDFSGSNINIGSTLHDVSQSIGALPGLDEAHKQELEILVQDLGELLNSVPAERSEEAEAVAWAAEQVVTSVSTEKPNKVRVEITKDGLLKAAQNVAAVTPAIVAVAERIAAVIERRITGGQL